MCWRRRSNAIPKRVIWEIDDWIFRDAPDDRSRIVSAGRSLPAECQGHRGISVERRDGAGIGVDIGAVDPPLRPLVTRLTSGSDVQIFDSRGRRHQYAARPATMSPQPTTPKKAMAAFRRIDDPVRSDAISPTGLRLRRHGAQFRARYDRPDRTKSRMCSSTSTFRPIQSCNSWRCADASPATLKIVYDFTAYASQRLAQFANVRLHDFRAASRRSPMISAITAT